MIVKERFFVTFFLKNKKPVNGFVFFTVLIVSKRTKNYHLSQQNFCSNTCCFFLSSVIKCIRTYIRFFFELLFNDSIFEILSLL